MDDLVEIPEEHLGVFQGNEVLLKSGKFGAYVVCGDMKVSVKQLAKPVDTIQLGDVLALLEMKKREKERAELGLTTLDISSIPDTYQNASISTLSPETTESPTIRVLTPEMSVRMGKYGAYVYYQKAGVKKPTFLNIKKFKEDCWKCNLDVLLTWIQTTYSV